jgi:alkylation response protein AidB-like acyl-CoA dehydrogenase
MMIRNIENEINLIRKSAAEFAQKALTLDRNEHDQYPFLKGIDDLMRQAYDLDFFHILLPDRFDGIDQGMEAFCVLLDEICREDASLGVSIFTNALAQQILLLAGADDLLKAIASNPKTFEDFLIAFPAMNNPSEVSHVSRAIVSGNGYLLSGKIDYLVLGNVARQAIIPAVINDEKAFSWFLIDLTKNNSVKSDPVLSLGVRACPAVDLTLYLAPSDIIGKPGDGAKYFDQLTLKMAAASASSGKILPSVQISRVNLS